MNIQHNCAANGCGATGHRPVYQERRRTEHTVPAVVHNRRPDDLMLNTAQMRDAIYLQRFRISSESLDMDDIVHQSAVREFNSSKKPAKESTSQGKRCASSTNVPAVGISPTSVNSTPLSRPRPRQLSNLIPGNIHS